jgi:putative DNA methylase
MASRLNDDGLLVTYYAHTSPDAWKALLVAGWEAAGLRVTNAFPIATEFAQSIVSKGKLSMDTSIVVVWRKGSEGSVDASDLYAEMVDEATKRANSLLELGAVGRDLVIGTMAVALATATKYREVRVMGKIDVETLVTKYVYPAAYLGLAKALARKAELKDGIKSPDGMFYLLVKSTFAGAKKKILDSTDARIFSIGTSLDLNTALKTWRILKAGEKESGAKVGKAKTLALMEPTSAERSKLAELLETRGIGATEPKPRCTVDALHILEYFAVTHPREEFKRKLEQLKASYPAHVEDALTMARIMAKVLPPEDIEKSLCSRIIEHLEPVTPTLGKFTSNEEK